MRRLSCGNLSGVSTEDRFSDPYWTREKLRDFAGKRIAEFSNYSGTVLDLAEMRLTELPRGVGELKSATSLNLERTSLVSSQQRFVICKGSIHLCRNTIRQLLHNIGELENLAVFDLEDNLLGELSNSFRQLEI